MKRLAPLAALLILATTVRAQVGGGGVQGGGQPSFGAVAPSGTCGPNNIFELTTNGAGPLTYNGTPVNTPSYQISCAGM